MPVTLLPGDLLKFEQDLVLLQGGGPLRGGSAAAGGAWPASGFSLSLLTTSRTGVAAASV